MRKHKLLRTMLLDKILIGIVPVVGLLCFLAVQMSVLNNKSFMQMQQSALSSSAQVLSERYEDLLVMRGKLERNDTVTAFREQGEGVDYALLGSLSDCALPRTFYTHFWLKLDKNDYFYSAAGVTEHANAFNADDGSVYRFSEYTQAELFDRMASARDITILSSTPVTVSSKTEKYLVVVVPIRRLGAVRIGTLLAFVRCSALSQVIGGSAGENYGGALVDSEGTVYFSDFAALPKAAAEIEYGKVDGYHVFAAESYFGDLRLVRLVSVSYAARGNETVYYLTATLAALCTMWVVGMIIVSTRLEYTPIKNISENIRKFVMDGAAGVKAEDDEIGVLKKTLDYLQNVSISAKKTDSVRAGDFELAAYFAGLGEYSLPERQQHCVLLMRAPGYRQLSEDKTLTSLLRRVRGDVETAYIVDADRVSLLASYDGNNQFNGFINRLFDELYRADPKARLAIGSTTPTEARRSYDDALFTLRFMEGKCVDGVYSFDMVSDGGGQSKQMLPLLSALEYAVRTGSRKAEEALAGVKRFIVDPETSMDNSRTAFLFARELLLDELKKGMEGEAYERLHRLVDVEIRDVNIMTMLLDALGDSFSQTSAQSGFDVDGVNAYIAAHYLDEDFSLVTASEAFGLNPSVFSRRYKAAAGAGFKESVDRLKMDEAARLLKQTDLTVEQIATKLNYSNASNFLRAFKVAYGVSPGRYRQQ